MAELPQLDEAVLQEWIIAQRWFGSKAREVAHIDVVEAVALRDEPPRLVLALIEARFGEGTHETYQVPLGLRPADEGWSERVILQSDGWTVYDALADPAGGRELLHRMRSGSELTTDQGMLRFLSARDFEHIAPLAGWYEIEGRLLDATLGILQEYLVGAHDGWELALDELAARPDAFLDRVRALGEVTGELHSVLGTEAGDPAFAPEEPSVESLALLTADVDEQIERIFLDLPETE